MDGEKLRDGIFALRTRRFGSVAEYMIKRLLKCSQARSLFHDLYDDALQHRIEVKFSVVQKKAERTVTEETVLRCIEEATAEERMVAFADWRQHKFDYNIQQIKRSEFDVLYYGLFFSDRIQIFRLERIEIKENENGGASIIPTFNTRETSVRDNSTSIPERSRRTSTTIFTKL